MAACAGKPTGKVIEEYSDLYGFAAKAMNAPWILQKRTGTMSIQGAATVAVQGAATMAVQAAG